MKKTIENKSYRFITLDGEGDDRAEVLVQQGQATVDSVTLVPDSHTAQVMFAFEPVKAGGPKLHAVSAWVTMDEVALIEQLQAAEASKQLVHARLEARRKPNIDRKIPFEDLYQNMDDAKKNTIRVVAIVDGVVSSEAVTNPQEDPTFGPVANLHKAPGVGSAPTQQTAQQAPQPPRQQSVAPATASSLMPAQDALKMLQKLKSTSGVSPSLIESVAAFALISGVTPDAINNVLWSGPKGSTFIPQQGSQPRNFAVEAPRYQDYNSDGRVNLGSAWVGSAVSMESAISRNILNRYSEEVEGQQLKASQLQGYNEFVHYFTNLAFSICDYAQISMYGPGARPSRKADSHTRIRGIFIDLIERFYLIPVVVDGDMLLLAGRAEVDAWIKNVGSMILHRFRSSLESLAVHTSFANLRQQSLSLPAVGDDAAAQVTPEVQQPTADLPHVSEVSQDANEEPYREPSDGYDESDVPMVFAEPAPAQPAPAPAQPAPAQPAPAPAQPAPAPAQPEAAERLRQAQALLQGFTPSKDYIQEETLSASSEGMFPAEDGDEFDDVAKVDISDGVVKIPAEGVPGPFASEEDIQTFKALLNESGFNLNDPAHLKSVVKVIRYTFGDNFSRLQEVPSSLIGAFVDWYAAAGPETMQKLQDFAYAEYPN